MGACRHERRLIARVRGSLLILPPRRLTQRAGVSTWNKAGRFLSRCCCCRQRVCVCVCSRRRYWWWWWYRCWCAGNVTILQTWTRCTWAIAKSKEVISLCKCKGASIDFADKSKGHRRADCRGWERGVQMLTIDVCVCVCHTLTHRHCIGPCQPQLCPIR